MNTIGSRVKLQLENEDNDVGAVSLTSNYPETFVLTGVRPRALVADDDPSVVAMLQKVLTRKGFDVSTARDGEEAGMLVDSSEFDVVLADLAMPRAGGLELFDKVRVSKPELPFIFVTGHPSLDSAISAMNKGAIAYLPKPFESEQVVAALERAITDTAAPMSTRNTGRSAQERFNRALAGLHLHYQPIVKWSTQSAYSYEALMRTAYTDVPHPGAFLDLAEGLGRVKELGQAVRRRAASEITTLEGAPDLVFVNLHPEELQDEELFDPKGPLASQADRFFLEITERESLKKTSDARRRIQSLKKLGFRIAIDDIGAGYSGLNSFVDLEPDLVKVDMGLVQGIDACARRKKLVSSLIELARELEIDVVAEGVETVGELEVLLELGCDLFQGYLFARPGPPFPTASIPVQMTP